LAIPELFSPTNKSYRSDDGILRLRETPNAFEL